MAPLGTPICLLIIIIKYISASCQCLVGGNNKCDIAYCDILAFPIPPPFSNDIVAPPFRGNRFNILLLPFTLDQVVLWQTPNRLLRAVLADIQVPEFLAGCKALGLINKIVTGSLWSLKIYPFWT